MLCTMENGLIKKAGGGEMQVRERAKIITVMKILLTD